VQHTQQIVVVGAGITGLSIALHLAERGLAPLVIEREGVGAGETGVQPGGVRQQFSTHVNCVLGRESLQVYRELPERLGVAVDATFDPCGYLFVAHSPERLEQLRETVEVQRAADIPSRIVTPAEAAEIVPGLVADAIVGAAWCDEDGYFDRPRAVVEAFAASARAQGVQIQIGEVTAIERDGEGFRVTLDDDSVQADRVIVAAGVETPVLLPGLDLPIRTVTKHLFFSDPLAEGLLRPLVVSAEREFAAKQLADGRLLASDLNAAGDPGTSRAGWLERVEEVIDGLLPKLAGTRFPTIVSGEYDATPDAQPIVGAVGPDEGLYVAAGFSGHGFMLAPALGARLAALVTEGADDPELEAFALARFASGRPKGELQTI
jgi:sarcosine oxidase subunit beta